MEQVNVQTVPLVDLNAQYAAIKDDIDRAMQRVIDGSSFIMGPDVGAFESAFAGYCDSAHCVGVSSGTSALILTLHALGVGAGDEVITSAHTFIATAEAISAVGATPVFVDIDPRTYNIDPDAVAAAITPATRAVIPVHIYGQPADMTRLNAVARQHDLFVIEDAAQSQGATRHGAGIGQGAAVAATRFYPGKNLGAYGDAGAVTTDNAALAETVALLRNHGRRSKYVHERVGYGERLDTLHAAILSAKLAHLDTWTEQRRALAARYSRLLADSELVLPFVHADAVPAWHLYVVRTPRRDDLLAHLTALGVQAGVHYPVPLHLQPAYAHLGYCAGELPVTEEVADTCLSLPLYPEMTLEQQDYVVHAVRAFVEAA
ncbi:MAG: DegT/DnrJ/EryC1/StrS family aminotransferase [Caldilineaceae bacterium]|nr:DegT/DnrJ/EryC1/StrS family aminotransferase [Caldilineaceae bacterium]